MGKHNQKRDPCQVRKLFALFIGVLQIFLFSQPVLAHSVYIYAWLDGDTVYTESYFGGKRKVKGGTIRVYDLSGKKLLEGKTNDQGEFSFKTPQNIDLRIVVEAGMGHQNEYVLKAESHEEHEHGNTEIEYASEVAKETSSPKTLSTIDQEELQRIVETALDKRLRPIKQELAAIRNEKAPGLTEIIGGIGYIFGILGVVMYFKSRSPRRSPAKPE
jgi:nickel transport protein